MAALHDKETVWIVTSGVIQTNPRGTAELHGTEKGEIWFPTYAIGARSKTKIEVLREVAEEKGFKFERKEVFL